MDRSQLLIVLSAISLIKYGWLYPDEKLSGELYQNYYFKTGTSHPCAGKRQRQWCKKKT